MPNRLKDVYVTKELDPELVLLYIEANNGARVQELMERYKASRASVMEVMTRLHCRGEVVRQGWTYVKRT